MADDSIAVVDLDRCSPDRCSYECSNFCPPNRTGKECITLRGEDAEQGGPDQVRISEEICLGETCGICVEKCPFDAIEIINLPSELDEDPTHRYGENAFSLYGLPVPESGSVTGILGPNGIGKTTAVRALAGEMVPNLGNYDDEPSWEAVLDRFRGTELQNYVEQVRDGEVTIARKPQYVDQIPKQFDGKARELLEATDERGALDSYIDRLDIGPVVDNHIDTLSGGELQRVALAATLARDRDFYFLDEISPYLDIGQRVTAARLIRELAEDEDRAVLVVEHDLAILDLLADTLHVAYGEPGAYGVVTDPKSVRNGINEYLKGYLTNENMRIRPEAITFEEHAPRETTKAEPLIEYPELSKSYGDGEFSLDVDSGTIYNGEVLGIVGPNGIGKSTLAQLFTGDLTPDMGELDFALDISYKPQYIEIDQPMRVDAFLSSITDQFGSSYWNTEIANPLQLNRIMERNLTDLSGGERQRVAIAACLSQNADLYLLDEPSAHLDVEQRVQATSAIRRYAENHDATVMVIDHDIYMMDLLADRLMVFDGEPSIEGHASKPQEMRNGMNDFLSDLDITFRRDERTSRPRINKPESQLDREQKRSGEYYYAE
ncbi:ribosome biogenesis/translation initiation ATPase RLI [Haloferax mediterranei ATCC 33500]|uniref:ATPase n=1 Tax=Haloferax mediterranei (strain ATCC 33500 / DSM 1411 / JCM 8866 / NBRC 14739 / NCIMB 2177 / R-4) TaxID=523841 RepID=I3R1L6_HALMT|nr:ribosome biogenesis/translation initiation ATPase RLI [Haloferax mediterranei]AFK18126.1 putative ATPase RIL [Haloferax mediterranei ATCC 33500]AHZ22467.1 ATPase [Haloferax mediterranei ATCC 33500]EMA02601.1 ATPase RIL [Haloferax mediterranei ATCC 33500]MDX5988216.1 ribosome biogenesis/translation initiation ATPase RLI [Haloferax mediterranei ATCC 33500]QCQ74658.1 ribosome biogenesis/translation initiation ATPase RLI [Haloferax mediterranei ATCC 33500]